MIKIDITMELLKLLQDFKRSWENDNNDDFSNATIQDLLNWLN